MQKKMKGGKGSTDVHHTLQAEEEEEIPHGWISISFLICHCLLTYAKHLSSF